VRLVRAQCSERKGGMRVSHVSGARYVAASLKWPVYAANDGHRVTPALQ
jgi:hypothetical protein